jgi:hypothetical protein
MGSVSKRKRCFCLPSKCETIAARVGGSREELRVVVDENSLGVTHTIAERLFQDDAVS